MASVDVAQGTVSDAEARTGLRIDSTFCPADVDPFDTVEWELRSAEIKDESGKVVEVKCTYLPETKGGKKPAEGGKVKGIIHWVPAGDALNVEVRDYDRLFTVENPSGDKEKDFKEFLNPNSLVTHSSALVEPSFKNVNSQQSFQFERLGYYTLDPDSSENLPVFNRTMTLKDNWA